MPAANYKELEILTAKIQTQLAPGAEVIHNAKLPGRTSKTQRQVDVLVRQRIGQYEISIIIDCKDHKAPIDVKGIEEFIGLLKDVGGHTGAVVCPSGFSKAAKTLAEANQIELFSPVDTDPHKWQVKPMIGTICDFREARIGLGISTSGPGPFRLNRDFANRQAIFGDDGQQTDYAMPTAIRKWNNSGFPTEPGTYEDLPVFGRANVMMENGYGGQAEVELTAHIEVQQQLFYGHMPVTKITGFYDHLKNHVITNAFQIGLIESNEVSATWLPIASSNDAPGPYALTVIGLVGWPEDFDAGQLF